MLDFNRLIQPLTQGQPPAGMTLLQASQPGEEGPAPAPAPGAAVAPKVDATLIAERVYQLMRQELRVQNERRAGH